MSWIDTAQREAELREIARGVPSKDRLVINRVDALRRPDEAYNTLELPDCTEEQAVASPVKVSPMFRGHYLTWGPFLVGYKAIGGDGYSLQQGSGTGRHYYEAGKWQSGQNGLWFWNDPNSALSYNASNGQTRRIVKVLFRPEDLSSNMHAKQVFVVAITRPIFVSQSTELLWDDHYLPDGQRYEGPFSELTGQMDEVAMLRKLVAELQSRPSVTTAYPAPGMLPSSPDRWSNVTIANTPAIGTGTITSGFAQIVGTQLLQ